MYFSLVIPVYNRPDEVNELLSSIKDLEFSEAFEVVIVEDGSTEPCDHIVDQYREALEISYFFKQNSGPGDSRNFGMRNAKGNYFIILDSDCILPKNYLAEVKNALKANYVDCFGGPDRAMASFSPIQKAINFAMTSFLTTGGIRGGSETVNKFQPRSFNMGISKSAFEKSGGFGKIHPGEDPDLSIRLWELGFKTRLFTNAFVYHKRRISWSKFYQQVNKFGKVRPILNSWHPSHSKITYVFPTLFCIGLLVSLTAYIFGISFLLYCYFLYFAIAFVLATIQSGNLKVGFLSIFAVAIQFYGYGIGFLKSYVAIHIRKLNPEKAFPELFFK